MLDPSRPGGAAAEPTGLKRERSGSRKILTLAELTALRQRLRHQTIVLCHGAFDLVHMGHVLHFEEAASLGDILVVTITADKFITKKRSVSFTEEYRMRQVAALEIVDYVALVSDPSAVPALEALEPDVYVKGSEYANLVLDKTANIFREKHVVEAYGGRIHFTTGETFSSTKLSHFLLASPEAVQDNPLLRNERVLFRDLSEFSYQLEELKEFLVRASRLRVCLLGETIVDEWVDITVTNLSQKSRCVAGQETARIQQIGATGIIALHLSGFVQQIDCFTNGSLGTVPPNVAVTPLSRSPLVKTRFVDRDSGSPLFEAKILDIPDVSRQLPDFDDYDLVLVADFGHGLLDAKGVNRSIAVRKTAFVTAMAQVNSSNYGYNLPGKYVGADYYSLNRTEAELSLHEKDLPFDELLERMAGLLKCRALSVTDGKQGVAVRIGDDQFELPTLSTSVIDTIGCGDAYFALSSVAACLGLPARLVALAGSIAAAAMTQRRCNERPVTEQEFMTIAKIVI
ncbi:MAG: PfkB family carbohydrate kinase [Acidobacteriota bacterium]